jgi:SAM-dependent methyltransferase
MTSSERWLSALETRHFSDLTFQEVSRALRALSATYVERRDTILEGAALSGAGKRAAFALFYGPLHYLLLREIVTALGARGFSRAATLVDLGCGTGSAGAAWAEICQPSQVIGVDIHPWALAEAAHTYREFGLRAKTVCSDVMRFALPKSPAMILASYTVNELREADRTALLPRLLERAAHGDRVLIVEPLARSAARWWTTWADAFVAAGGRSDEWRFPAELPPLVAKLDRAAGLNHSQFTGRSLYVGQTRQT